MALRLPWQRHGASELRLGLKSDHRDYKLNGGYAGTKQITQATNFKDSFNLSFLTCACCLKICLSYASDDVYWEVLQIELVRSFKIYY